MHRLGKAGMSQFTPFGAGVCQGARQPGSVPGGVRQFVQARPIVIDLLEKRGLRRHLDGIARGNIEGLVAANAETHA